MSQPTHPFPELAEDAVLALHMRVNSIRHADGKRGRDFEGWAVGSA